MRTNHTSLRTASVSIIGTLLLAGSTGCTEQSDPAGPLATASQTAGSEASQNAIPTDAIQDIVSGRVAAWAAKDAAAYASVFAPDLRFINPTGALVSGRDAFRAAHGVLFSGPFAGSTLTLAVRDIQFLTGTIAIVYLDLSITGYAFLPPGVPTPSDGVSRARVTWVVEKQKGEWQILFMQNTTQR